MTLRIHRVAMAAALTAVAILTFLGTGTQAQAGSAYRYWAYYLGAGSSWQYSQRGPATDYPDDGQVQGWRFAIQADAATLAPRTAPNFAELCAKTAASPGRIRVGIVLDFGVAADAPAGEHPPAGPVDGCVSVPTGASGIVVLDAAVGSAGVRIGTGSDVGLVCGIAGYPKSECAVAANPAPPAPTPTKTAAPATTATTSATAAPTRKAKPTSSVVAPPVGRPPATSIPLETSAPAASATSSSASASPQSVSSSPSSPSSPSSTPSALPLTSVTLTTSTHRPPLSAIIGGLLIVALAVGGWLRLRRRTP